MNKDKKVLHLTLKKEWFDMILSGSKTEEYREIKDYWIKRLAICKGYSPVEYGYFCKKASCVSCVLRGAGFRAIGFDVIRFKNGYQKDAPEFEIVCNGIEISTGREEWGALPGKKYFVIKLGEILKSKSYE